MILQEIFQPGEKKIKKKLKSKEKKDFFKNLSLSTKNWEEEKQNKQINIEDVDDYVKEEEKHNLSDSNILQYNVPSFNDKKILGKRIVFVWFLQYWWNFFFES